MLHLNFRFTFLAIISLIALGLSCWLTLLFVQKNLAHNDSPSNLPDAFMHDATYLKMGIDGTLQSELIALNAFHYPIEDEYVFTKPTIKILDAENQLWQISANFGKSKNRKHIIELSDKVNIQQFAALTYIQILTIETDALTLYPQRKFAETAKPVTITQPSSTVQTVGAKLDFNSGKLRLLSRVKVRYMPIANRFSGFSTNRPRSLVLCDANKAEN